METKEKKFNKITSVHKLAEELHTRLCRSEHSYECDWFCDDWDNSTYAHKRYLDLAERSLKSQMKRLV